MTKQELITMLINVIERSMYKESWSDYDNDIEDYVYRIDPEKLIKHLEEEYESNI